MLCERCKKVPVVRGVRKSMCLNCRSKIFIYANFIDLCDECSKKLSKCQMCGKIFSRCHSIDDWDYFLTGEFEKVIPKEKWTTAQFAIAALLEGNTVRCNLDNVDHIYEGCFIDRKGDKLSAEEVMNGCWFIQL